MPYEDYMSKLSYYRNTLGLVLKKVYLNNKQLGATCKLLKITVLSVFRVGKTTTLKMAKWLLYSYLQVALNISS